jgi:hypothetical protein
MRKINTVELEGIENFKGQKLTIDWIWETDSVITAF